MLSFSSHSRENDRQEYMFVPEIPRSFTKKSECPEPVGSPKGRKRGRCHKLQTWKGCLLFSFERKASCGRGLNGGWK